MTGVLGIVPVLHDDRGAPAGCAALRLLADVPLVRRAAGALARSGRVTRLVVPVPPAVHERIAAVLAGLPGDLAECEVLPVRENSGPERVAAALARSGVADGDLVVVHDPLHPLAPGALVRSAIDALAAADAEVAAVVPVRPVTDTLKWVDEDDVVVGTADRETFRMVYSPQAYRVGVLRRALAAAGESGRRGAVVDGLPRMVHALGGRLATVGAPGEVFRVGGAADLVLAEAMLHVSEGLDEEQPLRS